MQYQAVIWDIDGTLLNTEEGLVAAYKYAIEILQLTHKTTEEIKGFIGPVPQNIFKEKFGLSEEKAQKAADIFRNRYKNHELLKAYPYTDIMNVLKQIQSQGIKQAIATNKRQDYAIAICKHFDIDKYCSPILGPNNADTRTKADLIKKCVTQLNVEKAIMIGDTEGDRNAAIEAGINFIGVNYGFGFENVKDYANKPEDIIKILGERQNANLKE